ncbi:fungal-specific transcription factor domain-containing protein [Aspergillus pseudoustus]|uniref:Fungal-specific transcription factor domain-containing protein n=1 Tax=Aspergillus pseudoustus TaxID=1810923 RepID=A0ABR4KDC6_9EURO
MEQRRRYMSKGQRACDGCRARKSACQIDAAPPCRLCRAHGQPCEFTSRVRRRKSPRNDSDPPLLGSSPQIALPVISPDASMGIGPATGGAFQLPSEQSLELPSPQPDQATLDELFLTLCGTPAPLNRPRSLDDLQDATAQLCGLTGDMDPYVLQHYKFDANYDFAFSKLTIRNVGQSGVPVQFLLSKQEPPDDELSVTEPTDLDAIVPPEIGDRLIRLFLRFVQPQFPVLNDRATPTPQTAPTHLLAAIYCIAQPFVTFDDHLGVELAYTRPADQTLLNISWRSLNQSLSQPTIASIQTAIILLLRLPTNILVLDSTWKWTLLGMTVSMAHTLGLHLDPESWNLPPAETLLRRRLSGLIYVLDKWLAFSFGRPSHISRDDWLVTELTPVELFSPRQGLSTFPLQFSKLTGILDKALSSLYSVRAASALSRDFRKTFETARPLLAELADWAQRFPPAGTINAVEASAPLHMAYHAVRILVFRALLRPFNHPDMQVSSEDKAEWDAAKFHVRQGAQAEIDAALSHVSSLRAVDYQVFWAPWHKTCFALVTHLIFLLAVTSFVEARDTPHNLSTSERLTEVELEYRTLRKLLDDARETYRLHARSLDIIKFALLRIDAVFWVGWDNVLGFT